MKIFNKQKTHFMKKMHNSVLLVRYDTIENVHQMINNILDNGNKKMLSSQPAQDFKKESV